MAFYVCKSEPDAFGIADLKREQVSMWDGVRNYQVRNLIRDDMHVGDLAFFYHSGAGKETGIVGLMEVTSEAYPDPTQFDPQAEHYDPTAKQAEPRWYCVDMKFRKQFDHVVTLAELKQVAALSKARIVQKGNRLSISPLTSAEYKAILRLAHKK